jgi:hypothetical protein
LWPYAEDITEWTHRLEQRYKEFMAAAMIAGVDKATIESNFAPETTVWTPVQLRESFGTVEWRSPDTTLPSQILRLVEQVVTIVERLEDAPVRIEGQRGSLGAESIVLPKFDKLLEYVTAAIQDGVNSDMVQSYLGRMGFDVEAYDPVSQLIDGQESVTPEDARRLRLEYAARLEQDVFKKT